MERIRKVDITKMTPENVDLLADQIGPVINDFLKALEKVSQDSNKILNIYGLNIKIGYEIEQIEQHV